MKNTKRFVEIAAQLKDNGQKLTVDNVMMKSLLTSGGTLTDKEEIEKMIKIYNTPTEKKFLKLQNLCNTVNNRFKKGLNDDDQLFNMVNFYEFCKNEFVIIAGYDSHKIEKI